MKIQGYYNHHERVSTNASSRIMKPISNILKIVQDLIILLTFIVFLLSINWIVALISIPAAIPYLVFQSRYGNAEFSLMRYQTPIS